MSKTVDEIILTADCRIGSEDGELYSLSEAKRDLLAAIEERLGDLRKFYAEGEKYVKFLSVQQSIREALK